MVTPNQLVSRAATRGSRQLPNLIAQIYFKYNESALDENDTLVLDTLVTHYGSYIGLKGEEATFTITGHADQSGKDDYNLRLAKRRAQLVADYLNARLKGTGRFRTIVQSKGESQKTGDNLFDRRVDITSSWVIPRSKLIVLDSINVVGKYKGRLSNTFRLRTVEGFGLSKVTKATKIATTIARILKPGIGYTHLALQIQNCQTHEIATYCYHGIGFGVTLGVNRSTGWSSKSIPHWLDVGDFAGKGKIASLSYGKDSRTILEFNGPYDRKKTKQPVKIILAGWDTNVAVDIPIAGYWVRND